MNEQTLAQKFQEYLEEVFEDYATMSENDKEALKDTFFAGAFEIMQIIVEGGEEGADKVGSEVATYMELRYQEEFLKQKQN